MKQSKYTGKITARYLLLIFLQILRQLYCTCYMVTQLTNTQKSFFAPRPIKQQQKKTEKNYSLLNLNATSFLLFPSVSYPSINFEKTDLFRKEAQTTADRYTTEPLSLHFRPQNRSASRPGDQKKDGAWGR